MAIAKIIEIVGASNTGFSGATKAAVKEAQKTIRNIRGIEVERLTVKPLEKGRMEYRATCRITFELDR